MDAERQNRTVDTTIFSRVLYQLSYLGLRVKFYMLNTGVSSDFWKLCIASCTSVIFPFALIFDKKWVLSVEKLYMLYCSSRWFDILTMQD